MALALRASLWRAAMRARPSATSSDCSAVCSCASRLRSSGLSMVARICPRLTGSPAFTCSATMPAVAANSVGALAETIRPSADGIAHEVAEDHRSHLETRGVHRAIDRGEATVGGPRQHEPDQEQQDRREGHPRAPCRGPRASRRGPSMTSPRSRTGQQQAECQRGCSVERRKLAPRPCVVRGHVPTPRTPVRAGRGGRQRTQESRVARQGTSRPPSPARRIRVLPSSA